MKLGRFWTLMAAGLIGASLLLSPLAYAQEGTQGSTTMEGSKAPTKAHKGKKHHKTGTSSKKKTGTTTPEKTE